MRLPASSTSFTSSSAAARQVVPVLLPSTCNVKLTACTCMPCGHWWMSNTEPSELRHGQLKAHTS